MSHYSQFNKTDSKNDKMDIRYFTYSCVLYLHYQISSLSCSVQFKHSSVISVDSFHSFLTALSPEKIKK